MVVYMVPFEEKYGIEFGPRTIPGNVVPYLNMVVFIGVSFI